MKYLVQVFSGSTLILEEECLEWNQVYRELTLKYVFGPLNEPPTRTVIVLLGQDSNVVVTQVGADETAG